MSHLFITGFMGAGKTTVGRMLAQRLGRPFIDLDDSVEQREGSTVAAIFDARGEDGFREAEHKALEALTGEPDAVVATGGGVVLREDNRSLLRELGTVVHLVVTPAEAMRRLGSAEGRPLLHGRSPEDPAALLAARTALYAATADHSVDTVGRTADEVVNRIVDHIQQHGARTIEVGGPRRGGYQVVIGAGVLGEVGIRVREATGARSVALVTDDVVGPLYRRQVVPALASAGIRVSEHTVPAGERSKTWERAGALLERFAASGLDRTSAVIALGGGVVGDLAGLCAATFMRGIPVVQVPTTLLAQVDSAIGGKTAVDLTAGKNLAGAFWPPALVLSDIETLRTLPPREWINGLVEMIKTALLAGGETLHALECDLEDVRADDPAAIVRHVEAAAAFKASIVSADERESGLRECLNLGHTVGHAIEVTAGYGAVSHGMAVAEGLRVAALLAEDVTGAPSELTRRTLALLDRAGAYRLRQRFDAAALLAAMRSDKKSRGGAVRFVLLSAPGRWDTYEVDDRTILSALGRWASHASGEVPQT